MTDRDPTGLFAEGDIAAPVGCPLGAILDLPVRLVSPVRLTSTPLPLHIVFPIYTAHHSTLATAHTSWLLPLPSSALESVLLLDLCYTPSWLPFRFTAFFATSG